MLEEEAGGSGWWKEPAGAKGCGRKLNEVVKVAEQWAWRPKV